MDLSEQVSLTAMRHLSNESPRTSKPDGHAVSCHSLQALRVSCNVKYSDTVPLQGDAHSL